MTISSFCSTYEVVPNGFCTWIVSMLCAGLLAYYSFIRDSFGAAWFS